MKTIYLLPPSPSALLGAGTFPSPPQTTHIILSTRAPRLVKAARSLPALARSQSARDLPTIPASSSPGTILFLMMFAAAAVAIYLSAVAMLELAAPQGAAVSEPPTGQPPRSGAYFAEARRVTRATGEEVCRFADGARSAIRKPPLLVRCSENFLSREWHDPPPELAC